MCIHNFYYTRQCACVPSMYVFLFKNCALRKKKIQPGVRLREKRRSRRYPVFTFHILLILPTEFLRASSA